MTLISLVKIHDLLKNLINVVYAVKDMAIAIKLEM